MKSLGLNILGEVNPYNLQGPLSRRETWRSSQDPVSRVDGMYPDDPSTSDSVTFTTTPYIVLRESQSHGSSNAMKGLLGYHYGHDVGMQRDSSQVLPKSHPELGNKIVNIAQQGSLTFGSGSLSCSLPHRWVIFNKNPNANSSS